MIDEPKRAVLIARSDGPGTERFVGRALLDPLQGGCPLVGFRLQLDGARAAADFLFAREGGSSTEMIRCHLDREGRPRSCEIWRLPSAAPAGALDSSELARLLEGAAEVDQMRLEPLMIRVSTPRGSAAVSR